MFFIVGIVSSSLAYADYTDFAVISCNKTTTCYARDVLVTGGSTLNNSLYLYKI